MNDVIDNPADHRGLPDAADTRREALRHLRETLDIAVTQANAEALDDLGLCLESVKQQAKRIQAFDRALIVLLPEHDRDSAARYLRNRDAASLWAGHGEDGIPF